MKVAVIFYHKNAASLYKKEWIDACVESIRQQSYTAFDVFELNYGGGDAQYCSGVKERYIFLNQEFENHIGAMNYLYDLVFAYGYDVVFNTNMDDYYEPNRFLRQLEAVVKGHQLISSNFVYVEKGVLGKRFDFSKEDIGHHLLEKNHNIIAHPVIAMHKSFWGGEIRYRDMLGHEDLDLWQRAYKAGKKFFIVPEFLLNYRMHAGQVTKRYRS